MAVGNIPPLTPSGKAAAGICGRAAVLCDGICRAGVRGGGEGRRGGVSGEHAFNGGRRLPGRGSCGAPAGGATDGVLRRLGAVQGGRVGAVPSAWNQAQA
jgi:hypothetical protein